MRISINDFVNSPKPVLNGVPMGFVLGQLLFLIFITHMFSSSTWVKNVCRQTLAPLSNTDQNMQQSSTDMLSATAFSWGLRFSSNKCPPLFCKTTCDDIYLPLCTLDGTPINCCSTHKDLECNCRWQIEILSTYQYCYKGWRHYFQSAEIHCLLPS